MILTIAFKLPGLCVDIRFVLWLMLSFIRASIFNAEVADNFWEALSHSGIGFVAQATWRQSAHRRHLSSSRVFRIEFPRMLSFEVSHAISSGLDSINERVARSIQPTMAMHG